MFTKGMWSVMLHVDQGLRVVQSTSFCKFPPYLSSYYGLTFTLANLHRIFTLNYYHLILPLVYLYLVPLLYIV